MPDYLDYTEEQLHAAQRAIQEALNIHAANRRRELAEQAFSTNDPDLCALAAAMADHFGLINLEERKALIPCEIGELGYYLARNGVHRWSDGNSVRKTHFELWRKLKAEFDETEYIFAHTYFDACDNGYFYHMS